MEKDSVVGQRLAVTLQKIKNKFEVKIDFRLI